MTRSSETNARVKKELDLLVEMGITKRKRLNGRYQSYRGKLSPVRSAIRTCQDLVPPSKRDILEEVYGNIQQWCSNPVDAIALNRVLTQPQRRLPNGR